MKDLRDIQVRYFRRFSLIRTKSAIFSGLCLVVLASSVGAGDISRESRIARHESQLEYFRLNLITVESAPAPWSLPLFLAAESAESGDLRLSESTSPGRFSQSQVSVCALSDGSFIVAWRDDRQGASKIFLQKYSALGTVLGANVLAAQRTDGYNLLELALAPTISNKFYLAYRDEAAGQILCQRFNSDLTVDLSEYAVGDPDPGIYSGPFSIASRFTGALIVAYEAHGLSEEIRLRRFDPTGAAIGSTLTVNSDGTSAAHWSPSLTFDEFGGIAVAWEDYRSGFADIYLRRFDSLGVALDVEINLIDESAGALDQYLPSLVYSEIHGYLTAWSDTRNGGQIYLQRFSKQVGVGLVGSNRMISSGDSGQIYTDVALGVGPSDLISAAYCTYGLLDAAVVQRFDASLATLGNAIYANTLQSGLPFVPALAVSKDFRHAVCWTEVNTGLNDVRFSLYGGQLLPMLDAEVLTHDDLSGAVSDQPSLTAVPSLRVISAFRDQRNDAGDIFVQASLLDNSLYGANQRANQDAPGAWQGNPSVTANTSKFIVTWLDQRNIGGVDGSRIFARFGDKYGIFNSDEFQLSGNFTTPKGGPVVALGPADVTMCAWIDHRFSSPRVYGRLLSADGALLQTEFPVSAPEPGNLLSNLSISVDTLNRFQIAWLSQGSSGSTVHSRTYGLAGSLLNSFSFISDQSGVTLTDFASTSTEGGIVFILWRGINGDGSSQLYLSSRTPEGTTHLFTREVTDNTFADPSEPTVSVDGEGIILTAWIDRRGPSRRLYHQLFSPTHIPQGSNQPTSLADAPVMSEPTCLASRGRSWFAWVDARTEGKNIYQTGFVHSATDVADDKPTLPEGFALDQNFPNPFNPATQIRFTIPRAEDVTVTIFNISGRKVRTLHSGHLSSGEHSLVWNARSDAGQAVASGVYFYQLRAGTKTLARKMTLLK